MDLIPKDRCGLIWTVFLVQGIGTLLPWNMFITANDFYVNHKFNPPNATESTRNYQTNFLAYVGLASKFPNLLLQASNFFYSSGSGSVAIRIVVSLIAQIAIFVLTIVLAFVDTFPWITTFFAITIVSLIVINMANGIYQSCLFALAANMPKSYTNAVVTGMNISGTFAAVVLIVSLAVSPDPKISAIYYFSTAVVFLLACLMLQFAANKNKFYRHFQDVNPLCESEKLCKTSNERNVTILIRIWPKIWLPAFNNFMVMFVSLASFPTVIANISPTQDYVPKEYFSPVFCFLSFNMFAVIGNLVSNHIPLSSASSAPITIMILLRSLFIPFFLFCNYNPAHRSLPVLFNHDLYPIIGCILIALSSGYFSSIIQMNMPKYVELKDAPVAGMVASFSCMIGILAGVSSAPFFSHFVQS